MANRTKRKRTTGTPQPNRASVPLVAEAREPRWPWLAIWCVALLLRLIYYWQIHASDLATTLMGDAKVYDQWALRIAAGDWVGDRVFYQAPLYPYFLGLLYTIGGHHLGLVRIVQAIIGATSVVFLGRAGRHFFSWPVGLTAGVLLALDPTAIFFDGLIQKAVLDLFYFTLVLMLAGRITRSPAKLWVWLSLGVALGCLSLTRENAVAVFPWLIVLAWQQAGAGRRRGAWRTTAAMALGVGLISLPVALRNLAVGGEFHLTTSQLGPNFYIGNNPEADGTYRPLAPRRGDAEFEQLDATRLAEQVLGHPPTPREVSSFWLDKSFTFIREQPGRWLALLARKWFLVWNAAELGDTEEQAAYLPVSPLLRTLTTCLHFGVLCPLAALGVVWTWPDRRRLWILYAMAITYALSVTAFFVFARYRLPLVPIAILFASAAIVACAQRLRGIPTMVRWLAALVALGTAAFVNWPIHAHAPEGTVTYGNLGLNMAKRGKFEPALPYFRVALQQAPDFAEAHYGLGCALASLGQNDQAIAELQTAIRLEPNYPSAFYNLGVALANTNRLAEAEDSYRRAIELDPARVDAYNNLANLVSERGEVSTAIELLERAVKLDPQAASTYLNLSTALAKDGRVDRAIESLEQATRLQPDLWQADYNLGHLKSSRGDHRAALEAFRRADQHAPVASPQKVELRALIADEQAELDRGGN